jgi:YfiR/HmsC-like
MKIRPWAMMLGVLGICVSVLWLGVSDARASAVSDSQPGRELIGRYVHYFARNVSWPDKVFGASGAPFLVCMVGGDMLGVNVSANLHKGRVRKHRIRVREVERSDVGLLRSCQIVLIDKRAASSIKEIIKPLDNLPVLTVSDADGFAAQGGMIGFVGRGEQVAMQLNRTVIERAQLELGVLLK